MLGQMMQQPLLISLLLRHAQRHHADTEVVSRRVEGDMHRCSYAELATRAQRLANALQLLGVQPGDRVSTLAWNGYRHLELYYAVSGAGAVLHTLNPRLHAEQVAWIINHAQDRVLCFDLDLLPLVQAVAPQLTSVQHFVLMSDEAHMPVATSLPGLLCYETLLQAAEPRFDWPVFDENTAAALCYTSGTTGHPKGVLYSHRSTVLHALAGALPDSNHCAATDVILPVVPMFHVNAWGLPYIACLVGAKLVLPGPRLDGESLYTLMEAEGVTLASGVPTLWQGLLKHVRAQGLRFSSLRRTGIGGSACPPAMIRAFQDGYGVEVMHGWGMTETSPMVTTGRFKARHAALDADARVALQARQGRVIFGADMKVVDEQGRELPWDGRSAGELMVRGPWVVQRYLGAEEDALVDGWFPTGDVATIDADGYMNITDRSKDVIKSGGEWISSIDIENIAAGHPAVEMAACIARPDAKWGERPLLVVVPKAGVPVDGETLLRHFEGRVARWCVPDDVVFVEAIPVGPTGKMLKRRLREALLGPGSA